MIRRYETRRIFIEALEWKGDNLENALKILKNTKHCHHAVVDDVLIFKSPVELMIIKKGVIL